MNKLSKEFAIKESKACTKCSQIKSLSEFNKRTASPDGLQPKCRECEKAQHRVDYEKNRQRIIDKAVQWNKDNSERRKEITDGYLIRYPERRKQTARNNHINNREMRNKQTSEWRKINADKSRSYVLKRRGKIKSTAKFITSKEIARLYSMPCYYCGSYDQIEIDHVVPLSRGGWHSIGNLVPACRMCNASKGAKFLTEWRK